MQPRNPAFRPLLAGFNSRLFLCPALSEGSAATPPAPAAASPSPALFPLSAAPPALRPAAEVEKTIYQIIVVWVFCVLNCIIKLYPLVCRVPLWPAWPASHGHTRQQPPWGRYMIGISWPDGA